MTDSIKGISGTQVTSAGGNYSGGSLSDGQRKRSAMTPQVDLIEISQDARNRFAGKKKKSLLEYLRDLLR